MVKLKDMDQDLLDLMYCIKEGRNKDALDFLNSFKDSWNDMKESLDSLFSDIKRD